MLLEGPEHASIDEQLLWIAATGCREVVGRKLSHKSQGVSVEQYLCMDVKSDVRFPLLADIRRADEIIGCYLVVHNALRNRFRYVSV
jgi:hypothetical protein